MGHRLTKIYTRTGDAGQTGLGDGSRVDKDHPRIEAIGAVDELNCQLGVVIAALPADSDWDALLLDIQHDLFDLGGELSLPGQALVEDARVTWLEERLDALNSELPPLKNFILPGGSSAAAHCHLARAVCRRAERRVIGMQQDDEVGATARRYLNRLSDLLFVLARRLARHDGGQEILWRQRK